MTMADRIAVMNQGRIEQIGPPAELYEQPQTAFVAGFLGVSNLIPGTVAGDNAVRLSDGQEAHVAPGALKDAPSEVRIGVRPEKVRLETGADAASSNGVNQLTGTVRDVSYIGVSTQYIVDTKAGGEIVVFAQNAGRAAPLRTGDGVRVLWDPEDTFVITDSGEVPSAEELV